MSHVSCLMSHESRGTRHESQVSEVGSMQHIRYVIYTNKEMKGKGHNKTWHSWCGLVVSLHLRLPSYTPPPPLLYASASPLVRHASSKHQPPLEPQPPPQLHLNLIFPCVSSRCPQCDQLPFEESDTNLSFVVTVQSAERSCRRRSLVAHVL
jgi:hypothetical protein